MHPIWSGFWLLKGLVDNDFKAMREIYKFRYNFVWKDIPDLIFTSCLFKYVCCYIVVKLSLLFIYVFVFFIIFIYQSIVSLIVYVFVLIIFYILLEKMGRGEILKISNTVTILGIGNR